MKLTDEEKAMLDGKEGEAVQKAMSLLVKYGAALGAERLIPITNAMGAYQLESVSAWPGEYSIPAIYAQLGLDSDVIVSDPKPKVPAYYNQSYMDPDYYMLCGRTKEDHDLYFEHEAFMAGIGMNLIYTCVPYLCGNLPAKGEHIAWMESSAIAFANSVLGARTNCEGCESAYSAMLTGRTPYWGYHITENRYGSHLISVEIPIESEMEWGLLGYFTGGLVQERIPVIKGIAGAPTTDYLKNFSAATASSGGVEMFHIPGITAEANTVEEAFGPNKAECEAKYGKEERDKALEKLNCTGKDNEVDFVMLGCPHYSMNQIWLLYDKIRGKKIKDHIEFWVYVPRQLKFVAERSGILQVIEAAGVKVMCDGCPCMGRYKPKGAKTMVTDSVKQAHYMPNMTGVQAWYGSLDDCIQAAISGRWESKQ